MNNHEHAFLQMQPVLLMPRTGEEGLDLWTLRFQASDALLVSGLWITSCYAKDKGYGYFSGLRRLGVVERLYDIQGKVAGK